MKFALALLRMQLCFIIRQDSAGCALEFSLNQQQAVLISSFSASHIRLPAGVASVDVAETNGAAVMLCCMFRVSSTMHPERRGVL